MNGVLVPPAQEIIRFTGEVLRRPEFRRAAKPAGQRLDLIECFLSWLASRGAPLRIGAAGPIILKTFFIVLLVILSVYLVRLLLAGSTRWAAGRFRSARGDMVEDVAVRGGMIGSVEDAELALEEGDLRTAVRIAYRKLIERLSRSGLLKTALWKTSLTYLRECPQSAEHFPLLQQTVQVYNAVVYGHLSADGRVIAELLSELRGWETHR